jgi:hypothetical protein
MRAELRVGISLGGESKNLDLALETKLAPGTFRPRSERTMHFALGVA